MTVPGSGAPSGGWWLCLRFQPSPDVEGDCTWIGQSVPWLRTLEPGDRVAVTETLRQHGLACVPCAGPEEAVSRLAGLRFHRVKAWVLEPDGTRFAPAGAGSGDAERKRAFGVYPTPRALTRFLVRAVDDVARSRLGWAGLHDPAVRLLDPAAGPMNFVLEAYRRALACHRRERGRAGEESLFREHLLPHFQGIEILPASWAEGQRAARRFLGRFAPEAVPERFPLFLADALADPEGRPAGFLGGEAEAAVRLRSAGVNVIVGNPPFGAGFGRAGRWITNLLERYRVAERNLKWLQDDYVRFLRYAQSLIDRVERGVVALVVNHNCLEAPTFRGVRGSLLRSFDEIFALDLHGNRRKRETSPSGEPDENVFEGVAQGIALLLLVKGSPHRRIYRGDLYGSRGEKLRALAGASLESLPWKEIRPRSPHHGFRVGNAEREYDQGIPLPEIFPVHSLGVVTGRDAKVLAFRREDFEAGLAAEGRHDLRRAVRPLLFRPFDVRQALYEDSLLERPRRAVMSHLLGGGNLALLALRQSPGEPGAFVTRWIAGHKVVHSYSPNTVFPLWLVDASGKAVANLDACFVERLANVVGDLPEPGKVFGYVYSVLHDRRFLSRFREQLEAAFPRIPWPRDRRQFLRLADLGRELVSLHLLEDVRLEKAEPLAGRSAFTVDSLAPEIRNYKIGTYRVLDRWLRARKDRAWDLRTIRELSWIMEAVRLSLEVQKTIEIQEA